MKADVEQGGFEGQKDRDVIDRRRSDASLQVSFPSGTNEPMTVKGGWLDNESSKETVSFTVFFASKKVKVRARGPNCDPGW